MPLDFPSSPTNGQTYGNYYYDATVGAWNSFSSIGNVIPSTLKNLSITTDDVGLVPLTVTGASGQTANLQEWKNSAGSGVASLTNAGTLTVQTLNLTNDLTVANGGTGASTFTTNAYLKGNGSSAIQAQIGIPFADVTMQAIPAAADLNTYTTQGIYHQGSDAQASGGTNYPIARAGLLEVFQSGTDGSGFTYQRYTVYQSFYAIYTRAKYTTTWGAWEEVPTGTVTVPQGGTGATTLTSGAYLKGAGTSAITAQTGLPAGDINSGTLSSARLPSGTVLQVVETQRTASSTVTGQYTWGTTNITATITPRSTSSRIKVTANITVSCSSAGWVFMRVLRGSTPVGVGTVGTTINFGGVTYIGDNGRIEPINQSFVDSPATTSATTYTIQFAAFAGTAILNRRSADLLFGGISNLVLEEIA
jgi:hypothetical protein